MPDYKDFEQTYDELSNLAVDPAEMKADEEPKKVKEEPFITQLKKAITDKYGDIIVGAKYAKDVLKYQHPDSEWSFLKSTYIYKPTDAGDISRALKGALYDIEELLEEVANGKDLEYKISVQYRPTTEEYEILLFGNDDTQRFYHLTSYRGVKDAIKIIEERLKAFKQELAEIDAKTAARKKQLNTNIAENENDIAFIKAHATNI